MNNMSNERLEEMRDYDTCVTLNESAAMASELLAFRQAAEKPVALPECMPYLNDETLSNIINQDQEGAVANAARMLAYEVRFWHSKPLFAAPPLPVVPEPVSNGYKLPVVPDERAAFESFMEEKFRESIDRVSV